MNCRDNSSREPLNVLECQWSASEKVKLPKVLSCSHTGVCDRKENTTKEDERDLKLENELRLQEMREQGRQCLLERGETTREEGAANLLARFHSMHWMRQPHADIPTGSSQSTRIVDNTKMNLVPMKHSEDEYFPGTRQQKKLRRSKNARPKEEIVRLEEVLPTPTEKILPAGYIQENAWLGRKGSELFDSRKLNLTLYGPPNTDELYERAVQESIITWQQEQDRIVNMFRPPADQEPIIASEQPKTHRNLPNEVVDAWSKDDNFFVGMKGDGDGHRRKNGWNNRCDSSQEFTQKNGYEISLGGKTSSDGADVNNFYTGRSGTKCQESSRRSSNGANEPYQNEGVYSTWRTVDKKRPERATDNTGYYKMTAGKPRMDAGDFMHNEVLEINPRHVRTYEKNREGSEEDLESLGFNKTRSEQFSQRRREGHQNKGCPPFRNQPKQQVNLRSKGQRTPHTGPGSALKSSKNIGNRDRHIRFSEPLVQHSRNKKGESSDSDTKQWLEDKNKNELQEDVAICLLAQMTPYPDCKIEENSPTNQGKITETKLQKCAPVAQNEFGAEKFPETRQDDKQIPIPETVRIVALTTGTTENAEKPKKNMKESPAKTSHQAEDASQLPDPDDVLSSTDVPKHETEKIDKMREELVFLDSRLKKLTTALEQSKGGSDTSQANSELKTESIAQPVGKKSFEKVVPPTPEDIVCSSQQQSWFQSVQSHLSHPQPQPAALPVVHSLVHPSLLPLSHPSIQPMTQLQSVHLQSHPHAQQQVHPHTQQPVHPHTQQPVHPHTQQPVHPHTQQPVQPHTQQPVHPHTQQQVHPHAQQQVHPQAHLQPHTQKEPQIYISAHLQARHAEIHQQSSPQTHPQVQIHPLVHGMIPLQAVLQNHTQTDVNTEPHVNLLNNSVPSLAGNSSDYLLDQTLQQSPTPVHPPAQQPSPQLTELSGQQIGQHSVPPGFHEALLAHVQGQQISAAGTNPDRSAQIAQYLAQQHLLQRQLQQQQMQQQLQQQQLQQQQHLVMQNASAGLCAPRPAVPLNWLGLPVTFPHAQNNWLSQMNLSAGMAAATAAAHNTSGVVNSTTSSGVANTENSINISSVPIAKHISVNADCPTNAHTASGVPLSGNSVHSPAIGQVGAGEPDSPAHMQWIAQMNAFQQQRQQQIAQLVGATPAMQVLPMQTLLQSALPSSMGAMGLVCPSVPTATKIPPQYEGDWIISPADEARLGQGLPLIPRKEQDSVGSAQETPNDDPALSPIGSTRALGRPTSSSLKSLRPPVPLPGAERQHLDAQVPGSDSLDLSDFNPALPPPQMKVNSAATASADAVIPQPTTPLAVQRGLQSKTCMRPDEPRGRGRLR